MQTLDCATVPKWVREPASGDPDRRRHRSEMSLNDGLFLGLRGEVSVDRGDDLGAIADRCGNALDRVGADVADREHAAAAGLERETVAARVLAGHDKTAR